MSHASPQRNRTMLELALVHSSDPARLGLLVAEYTDARFETANLIVTALLRPYTTQDRTKAVCDGALTTAMSLSGEIAQVYQNKMDARLRPASSRVAPHVPTVRSGVMSVRPAHAPTSASQDSGSYSAAPETPVVWQWAAPGSPNFPAMYRDARTAAEKAAVSRAHHAFVRAL